MATTVSTTAALGGRALIITVHGDFEPEMRAAFHQAYEMAPPLVEWMVVNLSQVNTANLHMLEMLTAMWRHFGKVPQLIRLDGCNTAVRQDLLEAGLDDFFQITAARE